MSVSQKKYFQISSIEKGMKVLELLAEEKTLSVANVAKHLGFNRAGSHRYLSTLRNLGYVAKDGKSRYFLTFKLLEVTMRFLNRFEIRPIARPYIQQLAFYFKETVNLGFWDGSAIRILDKIDSPNVLRTDTVIGTLMPAYCSSSGKSILAFLPQNELQAFFESTRFEVFTPNTITSKEKIKEELIITKQRQFALDNEEWIRGIQCVGAPIFSYTGRPAYSISIAGPSFRMTSSVIDSAQKKIRESCAEISKQLGWSGPSTKPALSQKQNFLDENTDKKENRRGGEKAMGLFDVSGG